MALLRLAVLALAAMLWPASLHAQLNRSAVSVSGDDANACTPAAPCRSFTRAISQTNTGGEVVALTSGGYGPFTVNRAMTVQAAPGVYAGVTAAAGNGVNVTAGGGALVVLRGLTVEGVGTGDYGITDNNGFAELLVENCVVDGFANGIFSRGGLTVKDSVVRQYRTIGLWLFDAAARGTVDGLRMSTDGNNFGFLAQQGGHATGRDAVLTNRGSQGLGFGSITGSVLAVENGEASGFSSAVYASNSSTLRTSNTVATDSTFGLRNDAPAVMETWGNNKSQGNTTNVTGSLTTVAFQ